MDKCDLVELEKSIGSGLAAPGNGAPLCLGLETTPKLQLNSFAARAYLTG